MAVALEEDLFLVEKGELSSSFGAGFGEYISFAYLWMLVRFLDDDAFRSVSNRIRNQDSSLFQQMKEREVLTPAISI
jgi:hypothetical protein